MYIILSTCRSGGYIYCRTEPLHPKANSKGLYPEHRVVMENYIGRPLLDEEDVHHKNEDKTDNRIENLEILTKSEHSKKHNLVKEKIIITCKCGTIFELSPHQYRLQIKRNKSGQVFCSRSCASKNTNSNKNSST